jgi:hypothetical protein
VTFSADALTKDAPRMNEIITDTTMGPIRTELALKKIIEYLNFPIGNFKPPLLKIS